MGGDMAGTLGAIIEEGILPQNVEVILPFLTEADGLFISSEGPNWDFKESWPHSYSDSYFHGLCRLVCAFSNTSGGLIVFGVNDATRRGGKNRVQPNLDRFLQAFHQITGEMIRVDFRRYSSEEVDAFEVLLIPPLEQNRLPLRFLSDGRYYPAQTIWVRQGHEVVAASPRHIAQLYCRSAPDAHNGFAEIEGSLPPSPATMRTFVGRMATIDRIFSWLKLSDQPRTFLFGKGGSGKSTIAFQVAKVLRESGSGFLIEGDSPLETVMFLTAKERELNTDTLTEKGFSYNDFKDERSLYEAIITEGGSSFDSLDDMNLSDLRREVSDLFNRTSCFIVIDDIDTLTTKGLEAGFEFLIGALYKSKKKSKVLYTLRNAPSQAISNSIDVPGLASGTEYNEFVKLAADQFRVPPPEAACRNGELELISERRPLVIESVIALRRRVDSYERAIELFKQGGGDDVRRYVFRREWGAIRPSSRGRELLAVLALYKGKIAYDDLVALMYDNAAILPEALAEIQEMFVQVERSGESSSYSLNDLTRAFVMDAAKELDRYNALKARVQKFVTNIYAESPKLNSLLRKVDNLINSARWNKDSLLAKQAWQVLVEDKQDDSIREDPRYMAMCGYCALHLDPPNIADAREFFQNSFAMRHNPDAAYVREWFLFEQRNDMADFYTGKIFDLVGRAKGYDASTRLEFQSRRAVTLYNLARDGFYAEPERALSRLVEAMKLHADGYRNTFDQDTKQAALFERNFKNTTFLLKNRLLQAGRLDDVIKIIVDLLKEKGTKLDPLLEPVREITIAYLDMKGAKEVARAVGRLQYFGKTLSESDCWIDSAVKDQCVRYCREAQEELSRRQRK
jgi:energy-coupling factor transporter ATP-binding protein EcfA2